MSQPLDVLLRGVVANALGAPADIAGLLNTGVNKVAGTKLATQLPGGSEYIGNLMQDVGLVSAERNPAAELAASMIPVNVAGVAKAFALPLASLYGAMHLASKGKGVASATKEAGTIGGKIQIDKAELNGLAEEAAGIYRDALAKGKTDKQAQFAVGRHTEDVLKRNGNPSGIRSFFVSPYGEIQAVIDDSKAKVLLEEFNVGGLSKVFPPKTPTNIQDIYQHPELYNLSPSAAGVKVKQDLGLSPGSAEYNAVENQINLGLIESTANKSAVEILDELLRHELTHTMAAESGTLSRGTSTSAAAQLEAVNRVVTGVPTNANALDLQRFLAEYLSPQSTTQIPQGILKSIYDTNFGEWAAEAGAKYAPSTLPGVVMQKEKLW